MENGNSKSTENLAPIASHTNSIKLLFIAVIIAIILGVTSLILAVISLAATNSTSINVSTPYSSSSSSSSGKEDPPPGVLTLT